jgi:hypothetical protein
MPFSDKTERLIEKTLRMGEDLKARCRTPAGEEPKPFTVIVLQGSRVIYHGTHAECFVSQSRKVTPHYRIGYESWGKADSLHVEPGSECVTILASSNIRETVAAGEYDFKK